MSTILVTGGAGYVGAIRVRRCDDLAIYPSSSIISPPATRASCDGGLFSTATLEILAAIVRVMRLYKVEAVLHFGALTFVGEFVTDPQSYYDNNVVGSLSLLRAMLRAGCQKLVFSSSCAIYGEPQELPIRETAPRNPVNPYGASKLMVERMLCDYQRAYGLNSVALRYFNASGADPEGELGELRHPETRSYSEGDDGDPGLHPRFRRVRHRLRYT